MQRMQDKYKAQGQVELLVAELTLSEEDGLLSIRLDENNTDVTVPLFDNEHDARLNGKAAVFNYFNTTPSPVSAILARLDADVPVLELHQDDNDDYVVTCTVDGEGLSIETSLKLTFSVDPVPVKVPSIDENGQPELDINGTPVTKICYGYEVSSASFEFDSYKIVSTEGGEG